MGSSWKAVICVTLLGATTACLKPAEQLTCGEFTCGIGAICSPDGKSCVAPETVYACTDLVDGERCTYTGVPNGVCQAGICIAGGCGNGIVEAVLGEVCDDGNLASLDGCRSDCKSTEVCGDGIQDLAKNEYCDCGMPGAGSTVLPCNGPNSDDPGAYCRPDCVLARCGDGVVDPTEACDDGNNVAGDGCRADCAGRWTQMTSNTLAKLTDVWAVSATDAWAVGDGRIMRWDGASWYRQTEIDSAFRRYSSVCGRSSQDVFVVAEVGSTSQVLRYQGAGTSGTWSIVTPGNTQYAWTSVHCFGNEVWVAGSYTSGSPVGAYAISTAGSLFGTGTAGELGAPLTSIFKTTGGDVYVADTYQTVHKKNDVYWPTQTEDGTSGTLAITGTFLSGTTNDNVFVASLNRPASHHGAAAGWTHPTGGDEIIPADDVSAVPNGTTALITGQAGAVLECSGTSCTVLPTPTSQQLLGVWALDPTHAFIVGTHGTILY